MVVVAVFNAHPKIRSSTSRIRRAIRSVLKGEGIRSAKVSVILVGTGVSRSMNRKFLGHDYSTDVLSFTLEGGETLEGEVYVNVDKARTQAREYHVSFREELVRLVVHGVLHLAGENDITGHAAARMKKKEDRYVLRLTRA